MKSVALILSLSAAAVVAAPQYGVNNNRPSRPRPQTQQQCKTIKDIEYKEEFETKCETTYNYQLCVPTSRNQCDNKRRQKCNDNWRTVYDTKYEEVCKDNWRTVQDTKEVCNDRPTQVCEKHWEEDGKGGKIWADDPASCKTVYKTECKNEQYPRQEKYQTCKDEPKQYPRQEKYETCDWENYQDCYQVPGQDDCQYVAKQQCYGRGNSVKGARCNEEPKENCREVHKEVPYQVERRVCPGDRDFDDVRDSGVGGSFAPSTIADAFNQATRNENNVGGGGQEIVPGVRGENIFDIIDAVADKVEDEVGVRASGGDGETDSDAIVFG